MNASRLRREGMPDLATNAETQLLRESMNNPDLRIIMTVSESYYRLVARRSAGISKLADLKGKRALAPANTSSMYAPYFERDRLQSRGNQLGLARDGISCGDHSGHARSSRDRRGLGRPNKQS